MHACKQDTQKFGQARGYFSANIVKVKDEEATKSHEKNIYSSGAKSCMVKADRQETGHSAPHSPTCLNR